MVDFLEAHSEFDLIGGRIIENGEIKNYQGYIERNNNNFVYKKLDLKGNFDKCSKTGLRYKKCDLTFNFFVARNKAIKDVLWDEEIKVAYEHSSFFIDFINKGYNVAFSPDPLVIHKPQIQGLDNKEQYKKYRVRKTDKRRFFEKYNLSFLVDMHGKRDVYDNTNTGKIDFCITTFERYEQLERLLFSIVKYYPEAQITIADDGKRFDKYYYTDLWDRLFKAGLKNKPLAHNIEFDKGLSYKRNFLVKNTKNDYKLILEEDFVFTDKTHLNILSDYIEEKPEVGIVGGAIEQDGQLRHYEGWFDKRFKTLKKTPLDYDNLKEYEECDCVFNFFLARKEVFNEVKWDEHIKVGGEHTDFFLRLKDTYWKVGYVPNVLIDHIQDHPKEYKPYRKRDFIAYMMKKHKINKIIDFNGRLYELDREGVIKKQRI